MLNYFYGYKILPEVSVICSKLDILKRRISSSNYEQSFEEYNECKTLFDAVKNGLLEVIMSSWQMLNLYTNSILKLFATYQLILNCWMSININCLGMPYRTVLMP